MKQIIQCECGGQYTEYGHKYWNDKNKNNHAHTKRHILYQTKKDNLTPWELHQIYLQQPPNNTYSNPLRIPTAHTHKVRRVVRGSES